MDCLSPQIQSYIYFNTSWNENKFVGTYLYILIDNNSYKFNKKRYIYVLDIARKALSQENPINYYQKIKPLILKFSQSN